MKDRCTLGWLRIRGVGPTRVVRFLLPNVLVPSLIGRLIGALVSLAVGLSITKVVRGMRQLLTLMNYLSTQRALSLGSLAVALVLLGLVRAIDIAFGRFVLKRTARQQLSDDIED